VYLIIDAQYKILLSDVYKNKIYLFTVDKQLKNQNLVKWKYKLINVSIIIWFHYFVVLQYVKNYIFINFNIILCIQ